MVYNVRVFSSQLIKIFHILTVTNILTQRVKADNSLSSTNEQTGSKILHIIGKNVGNEQKIYPIAQELVRKER